MADQNENLHTTLRTLLEDKLGLRESETLTDKMNQVVTQVFEDKLGLRESETLTDKMNQVFEDKLQIGEGDSVNLPNVERQVGLLLGATPDAILQPLSQNVVGRGSRITEFQAVAKGAFPK